MRVITNLFMKSPDWIMDANSIDAYDPIQGYVVSNQQQRFIYDEPCNVWLGATREPDFDDLARRALRTPIAPPDFWLVYETLGAVYGGPIVRPRSVSGVSNVWKARPLHPRVRLANNGEGAWRPLVERFPTRLWLESNVAYRVQIDEYSLEAQNEPGIKSILDQGGAWLVATPIRSDQTAPPLELTLAFEPGASFTLLIDSRERLLWRGRGMLHVLMEPNLQASGQPYKATLVTANEFEPLCPPIERIF